MKIISAKWRNSSGDSKLTRSIHLSLSIQHCYVQLIEWRIEFQSRKIYSAVFHLQKFLALNQSQSSNLCHGSRQLKINILSTWFGRSKLFFLSYKKSFLWHRVFFRRRWIFLLRHWISFMRHKIFVKQSSNLWHGFHQLRLGGFSKQKSNQASNISQTFKHISYHAPARVFQTLHKTIWLWISIHLKNI